MHGSFYMVLLHVMSQCHRRRQRAGPQQIVPTSMSIPIADNWYPLRQSRFLTQPAERIILPQKRNYRPSTPQAPHKGRLNAPYSTFNRESFLFQYFAEQFDRMKLLKPGLRISPYLVTYCNKQFSLLFNNLRYLW